MKETEILAQTLPGGSAEQSSSNGQRGDLHGGESQGKRNKRCEPMRKERNTYPSSDRSDPLCSKLG